jgi:hypothetical protein
MAAQTTLETGMKKTLGLTGITVNFLGEEEEKETPPTRGEKR